MDIFNCELAKKVPLESLMAHIGIAYERKKGENIWYKSPFYNPQKTGSFKINTTINKWYDFALGEGGDTIKLITKLNKCNTSKALEYIKNLNIDFFSFQQPLEIERPTKMEILKISEIQNENLKEYLNHRGVFVDQANKYCKEITYSNNGKLYRSIGFENRLGGYELRNERFKSCFGKKDITYFDNGFENLAVFEGFIDFLSFFELEEFQKIEANYLILNSLSMINRAELIINNHQNTYLFLDNDFAGKVAKDALMKKFPNQIDMSNQYSNVKDLNDYLFYKLQNQ